MKNLKTKAAGIALALSVSASAIADGDTFEADKIINDPITVNGGSPTASSNSGVELGNENILNAPVTTTVDTGVDTRDQFSGTNQLDSNVTGTVTGSNQLDSDITGTVTGSNTGEFENANENNFNGQTSSGAAAINGGNTIGNVGGGAGGDGGSVEQEIVTHGGAGGQGGTGEATSTLTDNSRTTNELGQEQGQDQDQSQTASSNQGQAQQLVDNSRTTNEQEQTVKDNLNGSGNSASQSEGGNVNFQSHYQGAAATHAPSITVADAEGCADKFGLSVAHGDVSGSYLSVGLGFTPGRGVDIRGADGQVIGVRAYREMTDGKAQAKATKHLGETGREVLNCVIGIQEEFDANVALRKAINENDNDTQVKVAAIESFTHISVAQIEANSKVQGKTLSHICNLEVAKIKTGEHTEKVVANTLALRPHEGVRGHIHGEQVDFSHPDCADALKEANQSSKKINGQVEGLLNSVGFDLNMN